MASIQMSRNRKESPCNRKWLRKSIQDHLQKRPYPKEYACVLILSTMTWDVILSNFTVSFKMKTKMLHSNGYIVKTTLSDSLSNTLEGFVWKTLIEKDVIYDYHRQRLPGFYGTFPSITVPEREQVFRWCLYQRDTT